MVLQELSLRGKTALVTGGGSGIGSGITRGLAEAGADIACVYSRHPPTEIEAYVRGLGREFLAIQADVSRMSELPRVMDETVTRFGHLDILVNNAGICPRASALEYTEEMWDQVIQLNEKTVFFLSQLAAKQFLRQGTGGRIINLASMLSFLGGFNTTAYTASKHAVMGLTRVMASEWGHLGINVNAMPPMISMPFTKCGSKGIFPIGISCTVTNPGVNYMGTIAQLTKAFRLSPWASAWAFTTSF